MLNLGESCKECLCAKCTHREYCNSIDGNVKRYCHEECKGIDACMHTCSGFEKESSDNVILK